MSHFRRRRPRARSYGGHVSTTTWRKKLGLPWMAPWSERKARIRAGIPVPEVWHPYISMMGSHPAWWDRTFHTPRQRAQTRLLERKVLRPPRGADPEDYAWPLNHKPHVCYW